jgi:lactate racemase
MTYKEFDLPYGTGFITAKVPEKNISYVLTQKEISGIPDEAGAITAAMRAPTGSAPLIDRVNATDKIVVLVTDNTRACPEDRILPPVLAELERKVPRKNITIIICLGLHPPLTKEQMMIKLGKGIVDNYNVVNHDVNDTVNLGKTPAGTPIDINRRVVEADFRVSTGFIEPHLFAGFSGGRKSIAPGVFSVRAAYRNHGFVNIESPNARPGSTRGNPVHEDMLELAKAAKLNFIVNVLLNKRKEITHVVAGDSCLAHEKGCDIARGLSCVKIDQKVDITITTNAGAPLDHDFYQAVKGMDTASRITRDGGIIIEACLCNDGVGPQEYYDVHKACKTPKQVMQKVMREQPIGVQWENQILARIQMRQDVYLMSQLENKTVRDMLTTPIKSIEAGIERALKTIGPDAQIAVIPEGPMVIPVLE